MECSYQPMAKIQQMSEKEDSYISCLAGGAKGWDCFAFLRAFAFSKISYFLYHEVLMRFQEPGYIGKICGIHMFLPKSDLRNVLESNFVVVEEKWAVVLLSFYGFIFCLNERNRKWQQWSQWRFLRRLRGVRYFFWNRRSCLTSALEIDAVHHNSVLWE